MDKPVSFTGRCFCGSVRFRIDSEPLFACHCHCESCQRASGAAFVTWATFPATSFDMQSGILAERNSSPGVTRGHCAVCGSSVTYVHGDRPQEIDVSVVCLDDPEAIEPQAHIWLEDKPSWLAIGDALPQYSRSATND